MAVDWKTSTTRGIPTPNPLVPPGVMPFTPPGFTAPAFMPTGFVNPALLGAYGAPYGPSYMDPITSGYGFTPYSLTPFTTPFGSFTPSPYTFGFPMKEQLSDQDLQKLVEDILDTDPLTCNADIQVQCQDHAVTLTGTVVSRLVKIAAGNDAWIIPGVTDVHNTIEVKSRRTRSGGQTVREKVSR